MSRKTVKSLTVQQNVRCQRVRPVAKMNADTVGFTLTKDQAIHLARVLLAATQEWDTIDVTGFRLHRRKSDGTYPVTVTSFIKEKE